MNTPRRPRRTVFDLSPQELWDLRKLNVRVSATVPPRRPRYNSASGDYSEYAFDLGIYERYRDSHDKAKAERSLWLREHRITLDVVRQAVQTNYKPYEHAQRIGLQAPPMPEGYAQAMAALQAAAAPKPVPPTEKKTRLLLGGKFEGFSF